MRIESADSAANPSYKTAWWTPRLAGPLIAAAGLRLALLAIAIARPQTGALSHADTSSFLIPGRNLLLHGSFIADGVPDLMRTPGYPLFIAITSLAGLHAAALANVILSVFSVFLVWKLGRTVFEDDRIALVAAWIFAFEPGTVSGSFVLISDILALTLYLLSLERLAVFLHTRRLPVLAVAGLWLAAATFVRPVTYYLPVALALGLFIVFARVPGLPPQRHRPVAGDPGLRWKAPAVLLISVLPWLAAWQVRNWVETGYSGFSSVKEIDLYIWDAADVTARVEHRPFSEVSREFGIIDYTNTSGQLYLSQTYLAQHPEQAGWNQAQRIAFMHSEAVRIIRAHFGVYLRSCIAPLFKTAFYPGVYYFDRSLHPIHRALAAEFDYAGMPRWQSALAKAIADPLYAAQLVAFEVALLAVYLFAARGVFLAARGVFRGSLHNECLWLLLGTSLYFLAVVGAAEGPGATPRYRLPVMPAVCILAAAGVRRAKPIVR
jgi:hypothetical protein